MDGDVKRVLYAHPLCNCKQAMVPVGGKALNPKRSALKDALREGEGEPYIGIQQRVSASVAASVSVSPAGPCPRVCTGPAYCRIPRRPRRHYKTVLGIHYIPMPHEGLLTSLSMLEIKWRGSGPPTDLHVK